MTQRLHSLVRVIASGAICSDRVEYSADLARLLWRSGDLLDYIQLTHENFIIICLFKLQWFNQ